MNRRVDDAMLPFSQFCADGIYAQYLPQQEAAGVTARQPRRRRKKNQAEGEDAAAMRKRKLSEEQVNMLERYFGDDHKLESERKDRIAADLGLDPRQVAVWFQNRRARWKSKKLEEEYLRLKAEHENSFVEKCRLETQLAKLKEQLDEAEREIQRLSERGDGLLFSSSSPCSSSQQQWAMMDNNNTTLLDYGQGLVWDNIYYNYNYDHL